MEEYFDMDVYVRVKLIFSEPDIVWLLYKGEYVPFRKAKNCRIEYGPFDYSCSECGARIENESNYCPNCGARVVK